MNMYQCHFKTSAESGRFLSDCTHQYSKVVDYFHLLCTGITTVNPRFGPNFVEVNHEENTTHCDISLMGRNFRMSIYAHVRDKVFVGAVHIAEIAGIDILSIGYVYILPNGEFHDTAGNMLFGLEEYSDDRSPGVIRNLLISMLAFSR